MQILYDSKQTMAERTWYARVFSSSNTPAKWQKLGTEIDSALKEARSLCVSLTPGEGKVFLYDAPPAEDGLPSTDYWAAWRLDSDGTLKSIP